ncbi:MAG: Bug family tripartite tricarboxylate transporter substrate binding protein [Aquincola tertiaricarbonis]|uniref:Bug family tripartite tricarboxylate transporter substrate binding protein n=1 Tax=Aquincola TaxID=391952 RepID=UPI000614D030|nr:MULTISPECIES: tripartite tricarboxylate transporter substrate binding protein [Aquincola]MCR5864449.1 tripartite tricarboxylate transporter substrate binding protein [Aquincola sp. J276]
MPDLAALRRRHFHALALAALAWPAARAAPPVMPFPSRPITIVVMFPPGGVADLVARLAAAELASLWGQPVTVDNRAGANGQIAAELVARSVPDGHTLMLASDAAMSINPLVYARLRYDPKQDFVPVCQMVTAAVYLFVHPGVPATSLPELVAWLKAHPGRAAYGSYGLGSSPHLLTETFKQMTGTDLLHVPYKGTADAMPALLNGEIQVLMSLQGPTLPLVQAGRLKVLAAFSAQRQPAMPDVPTAAEQGVPLEGGGWFGIVAPRATPPAVVERLSHALSGLARSPGFHGRVVLPFGVEAVGRPAAAFAEQLAHDEQRYARMVKAANVRLDAL